MFGLRKICISVIIFSLFGTGQGRAYIAGQNLGGQFPATIGLRTDNKVLCTGVQVAPHFVLTAAHCNETDGFASGQFVTFFRDKENFRTFVRRYIPHPAWKNKFITMKADSDLDKAPDIAIIQTKVPLPFVSSAISLRPLQLGDVVYLGGMGSRGLGDTKPLLTGSAKIVSELMGSVFAVEAEDFDPNTNIPHFSMGSVGDSGGPVYRFNEQANRFEVVGLNRAMDNDEGFRISPKTGEITGFKRNRPRYFMQYVAPENLKDRFHVIDFLRLNLPSSIFSF